MSTSGQTPRARKTSAASAEPGTPSAGTSSAGTSSAGRPSSGAARPARPRAGSGPAARPVDGLSEVTFLTVAEVAAVMRVSKMTVYRMVHGGDLPAVRVGRSFRVPEQAVHDYLRSAYIEAG